MIRIYTQQNLQNEAVIPSPSEIHTSEQDWWMIYDIDTKEIMVTPQQCSGYTSSPFTMVIADTQEELGQYIQENDLIYPADFQ